MAEQPRPTARLLLDRAEDDCRPDWHEIPLGDEPVTIGRVGRLCDYTLKYGAVSGRHARITRRDGVYHLEDVSRNGVWLNDARIDKNKPVPLSDGATIRIPGYTLTFDAGSDLSTSEIRAIKSAPPGDLVESQSNEALVALVCLSESFGGAIDLPSVFDRTSGALLRLFRGAERCLIIRWDAEARRGRLEVGLRRQGSAEGSRFSQTLIRRAVEDREGLLFRDLGAQAEFVDAPSIDGLRSVISAPVLTPSGPWGVIQLDSSLQSGGFTDDDLALLMAAAAHLAVAVENVRLRDELTEQAMLEADKRLAQEARLALLPQTPPRVPGYAFFAEHVSHGSLGGEYFDFVPMPDGRIVVLLAEVGGGGVCSALGMSRLTSLARHTLPDCQADLADTTARLASDFFRTGAPAGELALTAVLLDPAAHRARVVCAGPEPLLYRADRATLEAAGPCGGSVGPFRSGGVGPRETAVHDLGPRDRLLLPGAGLTGAVNAEGRPFTRDRIATALAAESLIGWDPPDPVSVGERVMEAVAAHTAGRPQPGDLTLICLGRVGPGEGETGLLEIVRPRPATPGETDTSSR